MNDFIYDIPTRVYFGKDQLKNLGREVKQYGKRVLMVYGGGSIKRIGLYDRVMENLKENGLEVFELAGVKPNPSIESVREGARLCKEHHVDVVLAVGGGSTLDCSKFIAAGAKVDFDPWDFFSDKWAPLTEAFQSLVPRPHHHLQRQRLSDRLRLGRHDEPHFGGLLQYERRP